MMTRQLIRSGSNLMRSAAFVDDFGPAVGNPMHGIC